MDSDAAADDSRRSSAPDTNGADVICGALGSSVGCDVLRRLRPIGDACEHRTVGVASPSKPQRCSDCAASLSSVTHKETSLQVKSMVADCRCSVAAVAALTLAVFKAAAVCACGPTDCNGMPVSPDLTTSGLVRWLRSDPLASGEDPCCMTSHCMKPVACICNQGAQEVSQVRCIAKHAWRHT
jgi:hypothetical protein